MAAPVDIVNRALSKLGDALITSLDDDSRAAVLAASLYGTVRDAEISAHAWNFAKTRKAITAEAEKPAFGRAFQYLIPAECLRVLEAGPWPQAVMDDYINRDTRSFIIEGKKILTDHGPVLNIIFLWRVEDSGYYPPVFIEALACKLAVEMGERLTSHASKRELAWKEYDQAVRLARRINAIDLPPQAVQDDTWMTAHLWGVI